MKNSEETLSKLRTIKEKDKNIVAIVIFGPFIAGRSTTKNYRELRVFDQKEFVTSKFNLLEVDPNISMICVSKNPEKTRTYFDKYMKEVSGHHATVHLVTKDMFEQDLFSTEPCAIKRIILYRELLTIQGSEYIRDLKKKAKEFETELDKTFQKELLFKEEYLHLFSKNDITSFRFEYTDYKSLFPNIYKFITKEFHAGFPKGRTKLVYPQSMQLKLKFDIGRERAEEIL